MATDQEQPPKKEKKGIKKLWKKIKAIFKDRPSAPGAQPSTTTATPAVVAAAPTTTTTATAAALSEPVAPSKSDVPIPQSPKIEVDDAVEDLPVAEQTSVQPRPIQPSAESGQLTEPEMRFNKAQAIFAKYNLELSEADWDMRPKAPYERVAKNIRMRVRYTCHNCSTTFGHERVCVGCQHRRCTKCSRYPAKKDKSKAPKPEGTTAPIPRPTDPLPSKSEAACHECQTGFTLGAEECPNCHHKICERCLHEATITVGPPATASGQEAKPTTEGVAAASAH